MADRCAKSAGVHILGIESTDSPAQCIKLIGSAADVSEAAQQGVALALSMGTTALATVLPAPLEATKLLARNLPPIAHFWIYTTLAIRWRITCRLRMPLA